jgi:hypothetical protein
VAANATPNAIRGQSRSTRKDRIYRATQRGESTFMRERVETVAKELAGRAVQAGARQGSALADPPASCCRLGGSEQRAARAGRSAARRTGGCFSAIDAARHDR